MQKLEKKKTNVPAIWQYLKQFATPYRVHLNPLVIEFLSSLSPISCMLIPFYRNNAVEINSQCTTETIKIKQAFQQQ
jgi:hypothetical protein